MFGIAGAYLLRAIAESTTFPRALVVAIALAYAFLWLLAAARVKTEAKFASTAYAGTSVLILIPMLWELTLRFSVFSAAMTAAFSPYSLSHPFSWHGNVTSLKSLG